MLLWLVWIVFPSDPGQSTATWDQAPEPPVTEASIRLGKLRSELDRLMVEGEHEQALDHLLRHETRHPGDRGAARKLGQEVRKEAQQRIAQSLLPQLRAALEDLSKGETSRGRKVMTRIPGRLGDADTAELAYQLALRLAIRDYARGQADQAYRALRVAIFLKKPYLTIAVLMLAAEGDPQESVRQYCARRAFLTGVPLSRQLMSHYRLGQTLPRSLSDRALEQTTTKGDALALLQLSRRHRRQGDARRAAAAQMRAEQLLRAERKRVNITCVYPATRSGGETPEARASELPARSPGQSLSQSERATKGTSSGACPRCQGTQVALDIWTTLTLGLVHQRLGDPRGAEKYWKVLLHQASTVDPMWRKWIAECMRQVQATEQADLLLRSS